MIEFHMHNASEAAPGEKHGPRGPTHAGTGRVDYAYQVEQWVIDLQDDLYVVRIECPALGREWCRNDEGRLTELLQTSNGVVAGRAASREEQVSANLLQITFRKGVPFSAYLTFPRASEAMVGRTEQMENGFIVDRDIEGKPFGLELTNPKVTLEQVNEILVQLGQEPLSSQEWAPMTLETACSLV